MPFCQAPGLYPQVMLQTGTPTGAVLSLELWKTGDQAGTKLPRLELPGDTWQ